MINSYYKINFLFWNYNLGNGFNLKKLLEEFKIDVLILAENSSLNLKQIFDNDFIAVPLEANNKVHRWIQVFYRNNSQFKISHHTEYTEIEESDKILKDWEQSATKKVNRIQVFRMNGNIEPTFFACVHFPSKLYHDENTHLQCVPAYKDKVLKLTDHAERLFIVGDFNMNPFDLGMVEPAGFFAYNNKELLENDPILKYNDYRIQFYNPCWALLGDFFLDVDLKIKNRTGGTFYYQPKLSRAYQWHLIDQIILRKALINEFSPSELKVIDDRFKLDNSIDHYPLKFSFNLKEKL